MKIGRTALFWGIGAALLFWIVEALIHAFLFKMHPLSEELLPVGDPNELWMRILICLGFVLFGVFAQSMLNRLHTEKQNLEEANEKLRGALAEIRTLRGILPICACCKKIRNDEGYWNQLESYLSDRTDVQFSHGYCPDCEAIKKQEIDELMQRRRNET